MILGYKYMANEDFKIQVKGDSMQIISKDGKVKCVTQVDYPKEVVTAMKKSGYKVKGDNNG